MPRAAAEIEPVSRMLSKSAALPGPNLAPDWKTMLILSLCMALLAVLDGMMSSGLITLEKVHVLQYGTGGLKERALSQLVAGSHVLLASRCGNMKIWMFRSEERNVEGEPCTLGASDGG
jgi:hypothetical protein